MSFKERLLVVSDHSCLLLIGSLDYGLSGLSHDICCHVMTFEDSRLIHDICCHVMTLKDSRLITNIGDVSRGHRARNHILLMIEIMLEKHLLLGQIGS
jgi:hypothetical protein